MENLSLTCKERDRLFSVFGFNYSRKTLTYKIALDNVATIQAVLFLFFVELIKSFTDLFINLNSTPRLLYKTDGYLN